MTDYVSELAHHYEADPDLTARIISQMKSKGYFDQLRKEILADIDTKPAYQNMRQRVENAVNRYLKGQKWSNELNKNKLRDSLRRHLTEGRLIHVGPVLNQVLTPDVCSQIAPEVDKQICQELGIPEDEEMPEEDNTPNNRRRDGDFDGPGGSSNGPRSFEPSYGGGRLNGRAWGNDNDFFYPYSGGYNRFSRRCENHDSSSSDEDEVKKTPEKIPVNNMSQFDEMELEYSKKEVVELERKENPEEATKLALEQLAAQKFKIEQELQRMELEEQHRLAEEQRRREFEQQQLRELEEQRLREFEEQRLREFEERQRAEMEEKLRLEFEERQRREKERLLQEQKLKEEEMVIKEESEDELEEPKTPEMSDGEDSDGPELQVAEEDSCQINTEPAEEKKPVELEEAPKPVEPEEAPKPVDVVEFCEPARPEEPQAVPETPPDASPEPEEAAPPVEIAKEPVKTIEQPKKRTDERSRSRDDRHKSEHKKEHSSSSSSSKRHHSSSSSSKSSSHKSSSRRESTSKHSNSSSRSREDSKSSSHSRTSSRRDSEKHKSSSSSSSSSRHRRDDKHRSSSSKSSSSHKKGEDSNNLYYFTPEQSIEAVRSRIHLDEVMIRLEADNSGYDSLISDSETEDCPDKSQYEIEVENSDAIKIEDLLGIEIEGVNREQSSLEEINANEIIKPPPRTVSKLHLKINNGTWNHSERADANFLSDDAPGKKVLSVVLEKCSELDASSEESFVPVQQQAPPPKRRRIVRKVEQRYSTDDLYKPRTTFTSSRRSRE